MATVNNTGLVTGVAAGTSVITYTDNTGCSKTATVTVNPSPTITGTLSVCIGATTQLTGSGTPAAVNPWVSASPAVATVNNTGLVTGVAAGTSVITYTNNNGCSITATVTVNALPITGTLSVCIGSTTQLTGSGTPAASTPWVSASPGVATVNNVGLVNGIAVGTSVITYTNNNGCTTTATVTVNALPTITSVTATPATICNGSSGNLVVTAPGGGSLTTIVNYDFNSGANFGALNSNAVSGITSSANGSGFTTSGTSTTTGANAFTANGIAGNALRQTANTGNNWSFTLGGASLNSYSSYKIYFQAEASAAGQTITVSYNANGTGFTSAGIVATVGANPITAGNGSYVEVLLTLPAAANNSSGLVIQLTTNNGGGTIRIDNFQVRASQSTTTFSWVGSPAATAGLPANAGTSLTTNNSINVSPAVTTTYTVTATNTNGCQQTGNVTVTINPVAVGGTLSPAAITECYNSNSGTINLFGQTGSVTRWEFSTNGGNSWSAVAPSNTTTSLTYTNLTATTLFRAVIQSGVCATANSSTTIVTVNPPFTPTITVSPPTICLGQSATLTASGFNVSDTILGGDFANANPPGWSGANANNSNGAINSDWGEANGGKTFSGSKVYNNTNTPSGGKFFIVDGLTNAASHISILSTPVFSTIGMTSASFEWWQAFNLNAGSTANVDISLDGGATYFTIASFSGNSSSTTSFTKVSLNLNAYLGQPNVKVRFYYLGTTGSNWAIDDVNILGPFQPINYSWSGPGLSGSGQTVIVTPTTTGINTYTISSAVGGCAATTTSVTVNVNTPPSITTQPAATTFCAGSNVTFAASAAGTGPLTYKWQVSSDGITYSDISGAPYSGNTTSTLTITGATLAISGNYYRVIVTPPAPCTSPVISLGARLLPNNFWTGTINADWSTAGNWSGSVVPTTSCPDVYIPAGAPYQPVITSSVPAITNLFVNSGAILTIDNGTLTIGGTINVVAGNIIASNGTVELNGLSAQIIPALTFQNNTLKNLVISNATGTGVTLNGALDIYRSVTYGKNGAILNTNGFLTLKSTITESAWLGDMTNHTINGDVTVERYIATGTTGAPNHGKSWQLLAVPTQGQTIKASWQEGATATNISSQAPGSAGNPVAGYGTMITSNVANAATQPAPGFDAFTSPGPTVKVYNYTTANYDGPANTGVPVYNQKGYFVFVRGDRSVYTSNGAATPTILRTKGTLFTPANPAPATTVFAGKFESVGNPYASAVDMRNITLGGGTQEFFQVWDPRLGGAFNYGAFQTFSKIGSDYYPTPGGGSYGSSSIPGNYIQSGQAFFVQASGSAGTVSFTESAKANGSSLFTTPNPVNQVQHTAYQFEYSQRRWKYRKCCRWSTESI